MSLLLVTGPPLAKPSFVASKMRCPGAAGQLPASVPGHAAEERAGLGYGGCPV